MADDQIPRYKQRQDLSPEEHHEFLRSGGQLPETPEYRQARSKALTDAGLQDDAAPAPKDPREMSPAEHFERLRKGSR